jgi:putative SOS response-associated peptidase YedK
MCNLYSVTTSQEAIRRLFRIDRDLTGNLPWLPGVFPDYSAPVIHLNAGERVSAMMRWGLPSSQKALLDADSERAKKLEGKGKPAEFQQLLRMLARPTRAGRTANTGNAGSNRRTAAWCR